MKLGIKMSNEAQKKRKRPNEPNTLVSSHTNSFLQNVACAPWTFHQIYTQGLKSVQFAFLFFTRTGQTLKTC